MGKTALLVLKAQFLYGNDIFTLYANAVPGGPEPGSGTVKSDLDLGVVSNIGIYSTGAFTVDEIRIGTTYADVVPVNPKWNNCQQDCLQTAGTGRLRGLAHRIGKILGGCVPPFTQSKTKKPRQ